MQTLYLQTNLVFNVQVDIFRGFTLPDAPSFGQVFGGQLIGQACSRNLPPQILYMEKYLILFAIYNQSPKKLLRIPLGHLHLSSFSSSFSDGLLSLEVDKPLLGVHVFFYSFNILLNCFLFLQALAAACKTVDCFKLAHSLHAVFIVSGDINSRTLTLFCLLPIIYQVQRARDGKSFATRQVEARQRGTTMFTLLASFQKVESGFEHQEVLMPCVPGPETLLSMEELRERRITDPRLPMHYRNTVALTKFIPWPIEIKFCDTSDSSKQSHPSLKYWFKARGKLSDDAALHRCVVAYASDLIFSGVSLNPHRRRGVKTASLSLDHSIWFHRPVRADDWLLFVIESPSASGGRGFVTGHMFNQKGELIVSLTQECLIRKPNQKSQVPHAKL
ncbi:hypothetical protein ZIOFF_024621 [Zingiber officinale]|uniref:Acyl-CoA thioesterase n=1 Tax=Zingiber officinale TaxID=94328 RepID=A0A8J5H2M2_ZINOF|nr:hypothetical protein ZIOFF_024621 [Zingiber officinale]